jgi:tellurite methyltransferase
MNDRKKWEERYDRTDSVYGPQASEFLSSNAAFLPRCGLALDLASGEGPNSIFLAERGIHVIAVDISAHALERCLRRARDRMLAVDVAVVDLTAFPVPQKMFDVIVVFNYLQRSLAPAIIEGLRPGGLLVYETLTMDHLVWNAEFNREFLLERGELAGLFKGLHILKYREAVLSARQSKRAVASLIAKKV